MECKLSVSVTSLQRQKTVARACNYIDDLPENCRYSWYWNRKEIETYSPSRKDGIDVRKESQLRMLYCSFLQDIGMRLRLPQLTIATATMFCHRFYLHQSHATNEWQTIATVCMFLASKVEDTPRNLDKVVRVAYETMYQKDPIAVQKIHQKDVFEKQKSLVLLGERLLLCTIRFDFKVQHPYRPLLEAFRKLQISQKDVRQTAWSYVNDWLRTTLCLQFKPNYIAAGSLYLAAKHHNTKLPSGDGCNWWQALDIMPNQLDAVLKQMMELLGFNKRGPPPEKLKPVQPRVAPLAKEEASSSPDSCVLSGDGPSINGSPGCDIREEASMARPVDTTNQSSSKQNHQCELGDPENHNGVIEDSTEITGGTVQVRVEPHMALQKINVDKIKALMKMRKRNKEDEKRLQALDESSEDAWIERELEAGVEFVKRQRQQL